MKILLVTLKDLHTSAYLNLNYGKTKHNKKVVKMVEPIKTFDQYPRWINFGHFFSSVMPLSAGENIYFQKTLLGGNEQIRSA